MPEEPIDFAAEQRWSSLSPAFRARTIENTWCSSCSKAVRIVNLKTKSVPGGITLVGTCGTCGGPVVSFIEGPEPKPDDN